MKYKELAKKLAKDILRDMEQENYSRLKSIFQRRYMEEHVEAFDEILDRKISQLGNSAHVSIPVKHLGKKARVIILKDSKEEVK